MFFIWGNKATTRILGKTEKFFHCSHCGNETPFQVRQNRDMFTIYFIPTVPLATTYRFECPICEYGYDMGREKAKAILEQCVRD